MGWGSVCSDVGGAWGEDPSVRICMKRVGELGFGNHGSDGCKSGYCLYQASYPNRILKLVPQGLQIS